MLSHTFGPNDRFLINHPDQIEAIKFRMEQMGYKPSDLAHCFGYKSRVSEILHKKRKLSIEMISMLSKALNICVVVLMK